MAYGTTQAYLLLKTKFIATDFIHPSKRLFVKKKNTLTFWVQLRFNNIITAGNAFELIFIELKKGISVDKRCRFGGKKSIF